MKSRFLRYRFPKRRYATGRWPAGLRNLPSQTTPQISQISLFDWCCYAGLSSAYVTRRSTGVSHQIFKKLSARQSANMRVHGYHNQAHIAQVIIAAGLLADKAHLSRIERDILLLGALIHDYHHQGRWRNHTAFWQESYSFAKAMQTAGTAGIDKRLFTLLHQMVMATSPQASRDAMFLKGNDILSLLLDADLFGSLFLPKAQVDRLTAALKYEDRLVVGRDAMRDKFLAACHQQGLASLAGQMLHNDLPANQTYFRS